MYVCMYVSTIFFQNFTPFSRAATEQWNLCTIHFTIKEDVSLTRVQSSTVKNHQSNTNIRRIKHRFVNPFINLKTFKNLSLRQSWPEMDLAYILLVYSFAADSVLSSSWLSYIRYWALMMTVNPETLRVHYIWKE